MTTCSARTHANHAHQHGPGCGHAAVRHRDHIDYLHDGHLHHLHEGHVDEHVIEVADENPLAVLRARHIAVALQLAAHTPPQGAIGLQMPAVIYALGLPSV
jgi:hypothetical protein